MNIVSTKELDLRFYELLKEKNVDLFLEVGAFDAETSVKVKNTLPSCEVYAYEANVYNYEKFKDARSNINYEHLALSNFVGETNFYVQLSNNGRIMPKTKKNNSLLKRTEKNVQYETVTVKVDTIDNLFQDDKRNTGMWIDVEGVGYEVLLGANGLLENTSVIKIEVESFQFWKDQIMDNKIINLLSDKGFKIDCRDQEYTNQYNLIFVK